MYDRMNVVTNGKVYRNVVRPALLFGQIKRWKGSRRSQKCKCCNGCAESRNLAGYETTKVEGHQNLAISR